MAKEISEEIIAQVKQALNISTEIDVIALYKKLSNEYISCHPDKYSDKAKEIAEERFKKLGDLRDKLEIYIEQQRAKGQIIVYDKARDVEEIETINNITEKDLKILKLQEKISYLEIVIEGNKRELNDKEKAIDDFLKQSTKTLKEDLTDIYKPKKRGNILGLSSAIASLSLFIPQVQNIVANIGVGGFIGSFIVIAITITWIVKIIRSNICNSCIQSIIDNILYGEDLMEAFDVKFSNERYSKPYFREKDVVDFVDRCMTNKKYRILFFGKYNSTRRHIVEYILLELSRKKIIVDVKTDDMQKVFYIEHRNDIDF